MEATDADGNVYYIHSITGEMRWERPVSPTHIQAQAQAQAQTQTQQMGWADEQSSATHNVSGAQNAQYQYQQQQQQQAWGDTSNSRAAAVGSADSGEWVAEDDGLGNTYYRNSRTEETQWELPSQYTYSGYDSSYSHELGAGDDWARATW